MQIEGRTALVTGGSSGLGAAVVSALIARGGAAAILDRQPPTDDNGAAYFETDVTKASSVVAGVRAAVDRLGPIRLVFNCAGIGTFGPIVAGDDAGTDATLRRALDVNLIGTFNVVRQAVLAMRDNPLDGEERGVIVNTASVSAVEGGIGFSAYAASKAGVVAMTTPMALELAPLCIRVNTILPGMFDTPMLAGLPAQDRAMIARNTIFPRRAGHPARFAELALHIAENDYINAATIRIDAGARTPLPA